MSSGDNSKVLNGNRPGGLFRPKIRRKDFDLDFGNATKNFISLKNFENTNLASSSSFRYGNKKGMVSTQELSIDFSKFENHTFFHSAVAKVNEAFDSIINYYPFDGNRKIVESFEDNLTGFEKYVLDQFPKNIGYLIFSGTQKGENTNKGTFIKVNDAVGSKYTSISSDKSGKQILNPKKSPFTFEMHLNLPKQANDNQIIAQKISGSSYSYNVTLALSESASTTTGSLVFGITSGSNYLYVTGSVPKGNFHHIAATYNRDTDQKANLVIDTVNIFTSSTQELFDDLDFKSSNLLIGSGSAVRLNNNSLLFTPQQSLSGSIDEFRYFKAQRSIKDLKKYRYKNLDFNSKSQLSGSITLCYRFNEPYGTYPGNNVILDYSGNALHSEISNFNILNRATGSFIPLLSEIKSNNVVLFPRFNKISTLNTNLMTTASLYDDFNPNLITKLVPHHYLDEGNDYENFNQVMGTFNNSFSGGRLPKSGEDKSAQLLVTFLLIWGKFFDEMKLFIDNVSDLQNLSYDKFRTIPDKLLYEMGLVNGIEFHALFKVANISQLFDGVDLSKDPGVSALSLNKIQNTIWKRILASLEYLRKSKGTIDSVKSIFRSAGVEPDNLLLMREYGGGLKRSIDDAKEQKIDTLHFLNMSGSSADVASTLDYQGRPNKKPTIKSAFLSGSRIEIGKPEIKRVFATGEVNFKSDDVADYNGNRIDLISTKNNLVRYTFDSSSTYSTGDQVESGGFLFTIVSINGLSTKAQIAAQFKAAVEHENGHSGEISVNLVSAVAGLTQIHADGFVANGANSTIVKTGMGDSIVTVSGFSGGIGFEKEGNNYFHGISTTSSDGLLTSGSFTYEGQYVFQNNIKHSVTQSLVRYHTTGSANPSKYESACTNLIYNTKGKELTLVFLDSHSIAAENKLKINNIDLNDGDVWNISFGYTDPRDLNLIKHSSGSIFLRAGKEVQGRIISNFYHTASFVKEKTDSVFKNISANYNTLGSFICIGSQSLKNDSGTRFINGSTNDLYKSTNFSGLVGGIRHWSKTISLEEWKEHTRNPMNRGVNNPIKNNMFQKVESGSYERLRLYTHQKQHTSASNPAGGFTLYDFSQNNFHFTGAGFEISKNVTKPIQKLYIKNTSNYDISIADSKVRVRSLQEQKRLQEHKYAIVSPVYEVPPSEQTIDDPRFSIEYTIMKGLNEDIMNVFSDYDFINNALGKPNLVFSDRYPDFINLRSLYFNNVLEKIDLGKYSELFKWIDNSFTQIIYNLLPHTTKFMGINLIYENHMLERNKFKYLFDEIYMKALPRNSDEDFDLSLYNIHLQKF